MCTATSAIRSMVGSIGSGGTATSGTRSCATLATCTDRSPIRSRSATIRTAATSIRRSPATGCCRASSSKAPVLDVARGCASIFASSAMHLLGDAGVGGEQGRGRPADGLLDLLGHRDQVVDDRVELVEVGVTHGLNSLHRRGRTAGQLAVNGGERLDRRNSRSAALIRSASACPGRPTIEAMDPTTQGVLFTAARAWSSARCTVLAWRVSERQLRGTPPGGRSRTRPSCRPASPPSSACCAPARWSSTSTTRSCRPPRRRTPSGSCATASCAVPELLDLVQQVRRDGEIRQTELEVGRGPGQRRRTSYARVAPLSSRLVLVLAEDRTRERRVEAIRRDFVANVSHELKTPVGALTLLAEAVQEAADDPEAVQPLRRPDADRGDPAQPARAADHRAVAAAGRRRRSRSRRCRVDVDRGRRARRSTSTRSRRRPRTSRSCTTASAACRSSATPTRCRLALSNLVANAVAYSPEHSRVVVSALPAGADGRHHRDRPGHRHPAARSSTGSSSGSTASTRPGTAPPAAPASGCRSSSTSRPRTAARSRSGPRRARAPPSPCACRAAPPVDDDGRRGRPGTHLYAKESP